MWLNIWSELSIPSDKKVAYNKMIGQVDGNTNINYNNNQSLNLCTSIFGFVKI